HQAARNHPAAAEAGSARNRSQRGGSRPRMRRGPARSPGSLGLWRDVRPGGQRRRRSEARDEQPPQVRAFVITICDTGPLVAYLNRNDPYHGWTVALMKQIRPPLLTTEPVLTEVA